MSETTNRLSIPSKSTAADDIIGRLEAFRAEDVDWRGGRVFSLVYHANDEHEALIKRAHATYASANLLNPMAFKGLRRIEAEIIEMSSSMLNGPASAVGSVTSGGTESILTAVKAMRDRARSHKKLMGTPELIVPTTAHPAFDKGAHYFGVKLRKVPVGADYRANAKAMEKRINRNTIGMVCSAPQYPHGVVDPVAEIGAVAERAGIPLHVDACIGGFMLPWLEKLGRDIPVWDFRVPGVTSISADLHKYGFAGKGASVLIWRSMELMRHQFFVETDFPGGIYVSPTLLGTRPGGPIATAWAALTGLGEEGYLALARDAVAAFDRLKQGIEAIDGVRVLGAPNATIVSWAGAEGGPDTYAIADRLEAKGWAVDRQHRPACVHLTCTGNHLQIVDDYLADLAAAVAEVRANPDAAGSGTAPMYGMMAKIPVRGLVKANVRKVLEQMYAPGASVPELPGAGGGTIDRLIADHGDKINAALDVFNQVRDRVTGFFHGDSQGGGSR